MLISYNICSIIYRTQNTLVRVGAVSNLLIVTDKPPMPRAFCFMKKNAAGLNVSGLNNPNWKGGLIEKLCVICNKNYQVKRVHSKSRYCSLKCVGVSQRGSRGKSESKWVWIECVVCFNSFQVYKSRIKRHKCCSKECSYKYRSNITSGVKNVSWRGGLSRHPYPYYWGAVSKYIRTLDGNICQNPECTNKGGKGKIEVHHIDYNKQNCSYSNLLTLCTTCNTKANFNRGKWQSYYTSIVLTIMPVRFRFIQGILGSSFK